MTSTDTRTDTHTRTARWAAWWLRKPLVTFGLTGLALALCGVAIGIAAVWIRVVEGVGLRPLLALTQLLVELGAILLAFGLLGELMALQGEELRMLRDELRARRDRTPEA